MIRNITVLGAGTMGHGIAETFAMNGYSVKLYETSEKIMSAVKGTIAAELDFLAENDLIEKSDIDNILNRITLFDDLKESVEDADYVIEAVPEILELKQKIFKELDGYCKKETIFASNTSSLALNEMMKFLSEERKKRIMVCHWYNPPHIMPISELSFFGNMPEEIYEEVSKL
jgi:3-hydroxybutyryl-CoA dehydrogenase